MKWMIASDLHGSVSACRKMLDAFQREGADRLLLLGDLLYHGPRNGLPETYDPPAVAELLNLHRDKLVTVRGNCDAEVDQMLLEFPILSEYALLFDGGLAVYATHGHRLIEGIRVGDVVLSGHTHVPHDYEEKGIRYLNPGSVAIPKGGSAASYLTLENGVFTLKLL